LIISIFWGGWIRWKNFIFLTLLLLKILICTYFNHLIFNYNLFCLHLISMFYIFLINFSKLGVDKESLDYFFKVCIENWEIMFITTCSLQLVQCRVTLKNEGITRIRGLNEAIVECGTHILLLPLSKSVTRH
jgi:hypothetical protein